MKRRGRASLPFKKRDLPDPVKSALLDEAECRCIALATGCGATLEVTLELCRDGMDCPTGQRWYGILLERLGKKRLLLM